MPEAVIYISFNPAYNSIRYWTPDAAERARLEKETGTVATPFFATPSLTGDQLRVVYNLIELARRVHRALDDSEEQQGPNGRQHALDGQHFDDVCEALERLENLPDDKPGETMAPGDKAEWALRHALLPDGGIEAELQALRKKVATYEARDALGWIPAPARPDDATTNTPAARFRAFLEEAAVKGNRIYIAGPMTGLPDFNFPTFNYAAALLRDQGLHVENPAALLRDQGLHVENPAEHGTVNSAEWSDYLRYDIGRLSTCGAIYLLKGWEKSKGAQLEVHVALTLGMVVMYAPGAMNVLQAELRKKPTPAAADEAIRKDAALWRTLEAAVEEIHGGDGVMTVELCAQANPAPHLKSLLSSKVAALAAKGGV